MAKLNGTEITLNLESISLPEIGNMLRDQSVEGTGIGVSLELTQPEQLAISELSLCSDPGETLARALKNSVGAGKTLLRIHLERCYIFDCQRRF